MAGLFEVNPGNCAFRQIKWSTRKKDRYTCLIRNTDLTRVFVFGAHVDGKFNRDVTGLKIESCTIGNIPKVFARNFPNLTALSISGCALKSICKEDLEGFKFLTEIFIVNNLLEFLPRDLFHHNEDLLYISFSMNQLKVIDPDIFDSLKKVESINLTKNANIDIEHQNVEAIKKQILESCMSPCYEYRLKLQSRLKNQEMMGDLKNFISDEAAKDFTISVGESKFRVHKLLLSMRSPTLAEMLKQSPEAEMLNLVDIPVVIFEVILNYLYTDEKPPLNSNFVDIFKAASKLRIKALQKFAADQLLKAIDDNNALEIFQVSNTYYFTQLKDKSLEKLFPGKNFDPDKNFDNEKLMRLIEAKLKVEEASKLFKKELEGLYD